MNLIDNEMLDNEEENSDGYDDEEEEEEEEKEGEGEGGEGEEKTRILIFATKNNLDELEQEVRWFGDGTFKVAPKSFKQVYTINVIRENRNLPFVYALLPNKKTKTYRILFRVIQRYIPQGK